MKKSKISYILSLLLFLIINNQSLAENVYSSQEYIQNNIVKNEKSDIIEFIIDASGSTKPWAKVSHSTIKSILPQIPAKTQIGLRAFGCTEEINLLEYNICGKRQKVTEDNVFKVVQTLNCKTTRVFVPPQTNPLNFGAALNSIYYGGATPRTYALHQTITKDFASKSYSLKKKIILITDEDNATDSEDCGNDPCAYIKKIANTRKDITIDVIMLHPAYKGLKCLSDSTGGNYYNITSNSDFQKAMKKSTEIEFDNTKKSVSNSTTKQPAIQIYGYKYKPTKNYTLYKK